MVAFGREPCTDVMIQKPGADAILRRLITDFCTAASFDHVVCKQGQPPKVKLGSSRLSGEAGNQLGHVPHRTPSRHGPARDPSPPSQLHIVQGRGSVMSDAGEHRRKLSNERPRLSNTGEDLRKPRKQPAATPSSWAAAHSAHAPAMTPYDSHDVFNRSSGRVKQGKGSWVSQQHRGTESLRVTHSPARQGPLRTQGRPQHEHSRHGGMQRPSASREVLRRSASREPPVRARSSHVPRSRDQYEGKPVFRDRLPQDSGLVHEYLPPAPGHRRPDAIPVADVHPAAVGPPGLPLIEHAYVTHGRHDSSITATPLTIPAASIQDHFQAALAKAVQDVVKSMGIVPGAATSVATGVVPGPMLLGAAPSMVHQETYASAHSRPYADEPQTHMPLQGRAQSVHPEPEGRRCSKPSHARDSESLAHMEAGKDERRHRKRSRMLSKDHEDVPPSRAVMPRHAGGSSARTRNDQEPHRELSPLHGPGTQRKDRYPVRHGNSSHHEWRQSPPPPPGQPDYIPRSPERHHKLTARDRLPVESSARRKTPPARPADRGFRDGWSKPGTRPVSDRNEVNRKRRSSSRQQSPLHGRPAQHDGLRQYSSTRDLPLPPPTNIPRSAVSIREPARPGINSSGIKRFARDPSPSMQDRARRRYVDNGTQSHEHLPYHDRRSGGGARPPPDKQAASRPPPSARQVLLDTPVIKLRSGGSRVADRRRTAANANSGLADNEDAFAVEYNCFAVGDGFEGRGSVQRPAFNSGKFTAELVTQAAGFATSQIQVFVSERGRNLPLMGPVHVLQQASNSVRASGAAAVLLGMLNPLSGCLSIGKVGDVGYLVLRPPGPDEMSNDLEVSFKCLCLDALEGATVLRGNC